ncbi:MAG: class I SAM-dependent methyltransferase [Elusimicrobia bacterium]|nr:class I SAM-dependent methyltransferase [Elusimicrobiota bacterium]
MSTTIDDGRLDRRSFLRRSLSLLVLLAGPGDWAKVLADAGDEKGNFARIYGNSDLRERFYPFLSNVFHLYPEKKFHALILELTQELKSDEKIYQALLERIPGIKPAGSEITYALPALKAQKDEMARETIEFIGKSATIGGYLEIGTTGRYVSELRKRVRIKGPVYLVNDAAATYGVSEIMERGRIPKIGTFIQMGNYDPFAGSKIQEGSLDLVTNFIGLHHAPTDRLEGFVSSIRKVLKPGGRLIMRDHDVDSKDQDTLVALAHDVFNAGLFLPWKTNREQVRLFRSIGDWSRLLAASGFKRAERGPLSQKGDPTKNLLVEFVKA